MQKVAKMPCKKCAFSAASARESVASALKALLVSPATWIRRSRAEQVGIVALILQRAKWPAAENKLSHRLPTSRDASAVGLVWDKVYQSTRCALGWKRADAYEACSYSKSKWRITPSSSPTSVRAGARHSGRCGHPAQKSTALTVTPAVFSPSSGKWASKAQSSCSWPNRLSMGSSRPACWPMVVRSSTRWTHSRKRWKRRPLALPSWSRAAA